MFKLILLNIDNITETTFEIIKYSLAVLVVLFVFILTIVKFILNIKINEQTLRNSVTDFQVPKYMPY